MGGGLVDRRELLPRNLSFIYGTEQASKPFTATIIQNHLDSCHHLTALKVERYSPTNPIVTITPNIKLHRSNHHVQSVGELRSTLMIVQVIITSRGSKQIAYHVKSASNAQPTTPSSVSSVAAASPSIALIFISNLTPLPLMPAFLSP